MSAVHVRIIRYQQDNDTHVTSTHNNTNIHTPHRSYKDLVKCLVEEDVQFVDDDWTEIDKVKVVEPVCEFPEGYRDATLYQSCVDSSHFCLYFGDDDYEGLDVPYSFIDGVIRDGDGDVIELVHPEVVDSVVVDLEDETILDPELQELEENGGGYLSDSDNDSDSDFLFGGDGDKKIIKL